MSGALRGLDPRNVLLPTTPAHDTVEQGSDNEGDDDDQETTDKSNSVSTHMTRGARYGRSDAYGIYDQKC